jgi:predicted ATPase
VPATLGDTVAARLAGLDERVRETVDLAAVIGDGIDLPTLVRAGSADRDVSMDAIDAAVAVCVLEPVVGTGDRYAFVHSITRQVVLDRLPHTRCTALHARVAQTLEAHGDPALAPRIAHHYLAAHVLGHHERARHYAVAAARQAAHSLAFEEAALWFDRAATLPDTPEDVRAQLSFEAATNHVRAGDFARAREIYVRLTTMADPLVRLRAAMGLEEAVGRPGLADCRAADLLAGALADSGSTRTTSGTSAGRAAWAGLSGSPAGRARAAG